MVRVKKREKKKKKRPEARTQLTIKRLDKLTRYKKLKTSEKVRKYTGIEMRRQGYKWHKQKTEVHCVKKKIIHNQLSLHYFLIEKGGRLGFPRKTLFMFRVGREEGTRRKLQTTRRIFQNLYSGLVFVLGY